MIGTEFAPELAEEAEFVSEDDLLVVLEGIGEEDFDDLHPVAHIEADEEVVEDEELEVGLVKIDQRSGETDGQRELRHLGFIQKTLRTINGPAVDFDAKPDCRRRKPKLRLIVARGRGWRREAEL